MSSSLHADEPFAGVLSPADPSAALSSPTNRFAPFVSMEFTSLKALQFPVARIKKIMKSDEDVSMISGEVPVLFSKACELFILDMTQQAYQHTLHCKRRTLQLNDIAAAVSQCSLFDFLIDIVQPNNNENNPNDEIELNESSMGQNVSLSTYYEEQNPNASRQLLPALAPPFEE